ncbi:phosphoadenylyl-sulfate reductase [Leadbettera azotonutricia]|uniref:Adenosine 5'-phosphosulfate reductase n=1 Tax=Leadbettera azotonutricia (strain ATCC BAA-888 / DSM 13862 / ZAS-9) TaxID=545695 RepID=F5YCM0_LEAAZ|nr:phosphoadenylyl-sulfate reductase [Leadbettera azotonutricia]AEF82028.1 phosphoadenosine phosphosulfate reductase [Leadbettera azotonutricia ZAS-9]
MPSSETRVEVLAKIMRSISGPVALAYSCQREDTAALHLLLQAYAGGDGPGNLEVFTLNTHKLFPETEEYQRDVEVFFGIAITKYSPDPAEEKDLEAKLGEWGMRESLEHRHFCCDIRKVKPLGEILKNKSAWVTGLRASQSVTRQDLKILEYDEKFGLIKINPLYDWTDEELEAYTQKFSLPENPLYSKGYKSIGCAPCTRPVKEGEDIRAGRWWWENPEHKECGLHVKQGA